MSDSTVKVRVVTNFGEFVIALNQTKAPIATANFLHYVDDHFYDSCIIHRVIADWIIQGGGLDINMDRLPRKDPIKSEWPNGLSNTRGAIAMARAGGPDSATSSWFINLNDNDSFDEDQGDGGGYLVFGFVESGMEVVDAIGNTPTTTKEDYKNCPVDAVIIQQIRRL